MKLLSKDNIMNHHQYHDNKAIIVKPLNHFKTSQYPVLLEPIL